MTTFSEYTSPYFLAAHIREKILNIDSHDRITDYFSVGTADFDGQLLNPEKWTFLHDFIKDRFHVRMDFFIENGSEHDVKEDAKKYLIDCNIPFPTEDDFNVSPEAEDFTYLEKLIYVVSEFVVDETFTVLFGDRKLLMKCNKLLAEKIVGLRKTDHYGLLEKDGVIKKCMDFPKWASRAVFFRDKGSCAICSTDLSGHLWPDFKDAIDYIIPLNLGGSNDITNLQLICRSCNLKKLDHTIVTSEKYPTYYVQDN